MTSPVVSVLMAVYNAERWLDQSLTSLLRQQTLTQLEVVAVDDASTDASLAILQRWAEKDSRLRVLHHDENRGQAAARNLALRHASGEYVCMVDADDWLSPDALQRAVEQFQRNDEVDAVVLRLMMYYDDVQPSAERPERVTPPAALTAGSGYYYPEPYAEGSTVSGRQAFVDSLTWRVHGLYLVRMTIHREHPYDDSSRLYSDDNTTRIHYLHSRRVAFCGGVYYYRQNPQSTTHQVSEQRFLYLDANLSMRRQLLAEAVDAEVLNTYEQHRWLNYVGMWVFYLQHRSDYDHQARLRIARKLRTFYSSFSGQPLQRVKFGYIRMRHYRIFLAQVYIYYYMRRLLGRS